MGFPSPSQAPSSPSPAQLLPDGWVSRSSILRTIHFWGISAQSFLQLCRNVWGIIRIRPGGYKPPNTFRMCHLYSKHLAPTLVKASYGQKTILGSTLTPTLRRRELKLCKSELSEVTHVQMADMWPEPGPSDPKASRLSSSANVSIPFLHPTDTCEGPGIHRVLLFHLNRVYRLHRNFCHHGSRIQTLCLQCQNNVTRSKTFEFSSEAKGKRLPHVFITKKNSVSKTPAFWRYYEHTQDWVATFFLTTKVWVCQRASSIHGRSTGWSEGISRAESSGHQGLLVKR